MQLRSYQRQAISSLADAIRRGHRRVVLQAPTGSGKTVIGAALLQGALEKGRRALFSAHRLELVDQPYRKLVEAGLPEGKIGLRVGGDRKRRRDDAPLQIVSIDSIKPEDFSDKQLILIDEAHRAACRRYMLALEQAAPGAVVVGLTATPVRLDGKGLATAGFTEIVVVATPSELIEQGHIVDPTVWSVPTELLPVVEGVGITKGDYNLASLSLAVDRPDLYGHFVDHYAQRASGLRAVCFAVNRAHSRNIVDAFRAKGLRAEHVDGASRRKDRRNALDMLRRGELDVVSQCDLWIEGMDAPEVRCAILGRPTASLTIYLQSVGRVMRPYQGQPSIVLDHAGNALRHGLPSEDRVYSLDGVVRHSVRGPAIRRCPSCYLVMSPGKSSCPSCKHVFDDGKEELPTNYSPAQLRRIDPEGYQRYFWVQLWNRVYMDGKSPTWAKLEYERRFGSPSMLEVPPKPAVDMSPEARRKKHAELMKIASARVLPYEWVEERMRRIFG